MSQRIFIKNLKKIKMKFKDLKKDFILSETSFYKVVEVTDSVCTLVDDNGNVVDVSRGYIEKIMNSAELFENEEFRTMTELADLFINMPRIAMTVAFYKKDTVKTKKAYNDEVKAAIERVQKARVSEVEGLLKDLIENPISKVIPGELRVMKGRHYGSIDDLGRIQFIDMEKTKELGKDYDTRLRQVDPRTIQYVIVGGVKYSLKK